MTEICQETDQYRNYHNKQTVFHRRQPSYFNNVVISNDDNAYYQNEYEADIYSTINVYDGDFEDARHGKRKGVDDCSLKKAIKVNQYSTSVEEENGMKESVTNDETSKIEFVLVPEINNIKGSKGLVLNELCKVPQESSSSPNLSSKSLQPESHKSRECAITKLKENIELLKDNDVSETELNYSGHIHHAFNCPKLENGDCFLPFCQDPHEITSLVEDALSKVYVKSGNAAEPYVRMMYKICIQHAIYCNNRSECKMPLCKDFESSLNNLIPSELIKDDTFEVLHDGRKTEGARFYQYGRDFHLPHEVVIGKGSFGTVTSCWFTDSNGRHYSLAMKRSSIANQNLSRSLSNSLPIIKKLGNLPNILTPELIMRSNRHILMVSEKADMSLFDYMQMMGSGGLSVKTCTAMLFDIAKGINQLHSLGFTHGDIKVSNCVVTEGFGVVKIIDLDTVKEEDMVQSSGTHVYAAPEVFTTKTVRKPADVYSYSRMIPVLLFGTERVLDGSINQQTILRMIREKDRQLAEIYEVGTQLDPNKRLTAKQLVKWFRKNALLRKHWSDYQPVKVERSCTPRGKLDTESILKSYLTAVMEDLPKHLE